LANYSEISNLDEADFSMWLTKEHGVTVIPVSAFYADSSSEHSNHQIVRFCFAKQDATLDMAIEQLLEVARQN
jgi:methionine aminotransferase